VPAEYTCDYAIIRVVPRVERGANLFDSSPMYGEAERVLGLALQDRRGAAIVAAKVWTPGDGAEQMRRSLAFFRGRVELYQIHNLVNWRRHLDTLESLRDRGTIDAIGATHHQASASGERC
jgi:aryl-alcohol dehydrogenase-like predicted oxidoreductase